MNFPLKVKSTALQLHSRLEEYFNSDSFTVSLPPFRKNCFKAQICLFLACKFEDIHGHLDKIMKNIEKFSGNEFLPEILESEVRIFEFLNFEFEYVNLYQSALVVKFLMDETNRRTQKKNNNEIQWIYVADNLNKALCVVDLRKDLLETVISVFDLDEIKDLKIPGKEVDFEKIVKIRKSWEGVELLTDWNIEKAST